MAKQALGAFDGIVLDEGDAIFLELRPDVDLVADENRAADSGIALVDGLDGDAGNAVAQRLRTQSGLPWCCCE